MPVHDEVDFGTVAITCREPVGIADQDEPAVGQTARLELEVEIDDTAPRWLAVLLESAVGRADSRRCEVNRPTDIRVK